MFYSRELLARKASLGQLWLLGTKQGKLDRRKANLLSISGLCMEILNPSVPIAIRLSSILMSGVVFLYETKLMFLHEDATQLLVQLRKSLKEMEEPTQLPPRKAKASRKSVTLPKIRETSIGCTLNVDQVDEYYVINGLKEDSFTHDHHQAPDQRHRFTANKCGKEGEARSMEKRGGNKVTPVGINQFFTSGNSGDAVRYSGGSVSGDGVPSSNLEVHLERFGSKKNSVRSSTSRNSGGSLGTVAGAFQEADTDYKLPRPQQQN